MGESVKAVTLHSLLDSFPGRTKLNYISLSAMDIYAEDQEPRELFAVMAVTSRSKDFSPPASNQLCSSRNQLGVL